MRSSAFAPKDCRVLILLSPENLGTNEQPCARVGPRMYRWEWSVEGSNRPAQPA
jgi:hypothetical protein